MKILMVIDSLGSGGSQRQMVNLALGLLHKGHKIDFFLYYPQLDHFLPQIKNSGISVFSYKKKSRFSINVFFALRERIQKGKYDIVLSFLRTPNFYSEISSLGLKNIRLVVSERFMFESLPVKGWLHFTQQFHRIASYVIVNSHHQKKIMIDQFPWMGRKICTIYNGIDLDEFHPGNSELSTEKLKLLSIGSVVPKKNAINLIKAVAKYCNLYRKNIQIQWVGKITQDQKSQNEYREAEALIAKYGIQDKWEWLGEREDISELLQNCDVLIHPSFYEGLPNAICEALACGKPVLASRVCDHPILIKDGWNGYLFDPNSTDEISEVINKIASLPQDQYLTISKNARSYAEENLSLERYVTEYENLFTSLLSS